MSNGGRAEGLITVPTGGWSLTVGYTGGAGSTVVNLAAGATYYPLTLVAAIQAAFTAIVGQNLTITIDDGEGGSGRVTIWNAGATFSVTFTSTGLRDAIGFTGNIASGTAAQTGAQSARPIWIPGIVKASMYGDLAFTSTAGQSGRGSLVTDLTHTVGPTGVVHSVKTVGYREHRGVRWMGVAQARALRQFETIVGQSFESFALDVGYGEVSTYVPLGTYVRFYPDADVDGTFAVGRLLWSEEFNLEQLVQLWLGRWNVALPVLVVES